MTYTQFNAPTKWFHTRTITSNTVFFSGTFTIHRTEEGEKEAIYLTPNTSTHFTDAYTLAR